MGQMTGYLGMIMSNPMLLLLVILLIGGFAVVAIFFIGAAVMGVMCLPLFLPAILVLLGIYVAMGKIDGLPGMYGLAAGVVLMIVGAAWFYFMR